MESEFEPCDVRPLCKLQWGHRANAVERSHGLWVESVKITLQWGHRANVVETVDMIDTGEAYGR